MLKAAAKRTLRATGAVISRNSADRVIVLCYHSIHPSNSFRSATPELFREHLAWLSEKCDVVPFFDILSATAKPHRRPVVSITFDDGHEDNHRFALPALKEQGLSATFFLTAGLMEKDPEVVERFRRLRQSDYESIRPPEWSQVKEMLDEGMEVGAHSYSHRNLARLDRTDLRRELEDAKRIIEEQLQREVTAVSYPFGKPRVHFTDATAAMARESGYTRAAAIITRGVRRTDSSFRIPRIYGYGSVDLLREKVLGYWDAIGFVQEHSPLWLSRLVSPTDFAY